MGEEQVFKGKGDPVAHHLALRPLTAVKQKCLAFPNDGEGTDPPFHGGAGGGSSKEADEQRHGGNIGGRLAAPMSKRLVGSANAAPCLHFNEAQARADQAA
jgi:hypothetical protein